MNCPICDQDLTVLDLISATEHVNTCVEHGPSVVEIDQSGQIVLKRNLPPAKQRKICPICDKTFQNLTHHFKICAIKHDVPPDLMLQHWDTINRDSKKPKRFPPNLLTSYINKCVKDGRLGEQVDYARALVLSLSDADPEASNDLPELAETPQVAATPSDSFPESSSVLVKCDNSNPSARETRDVSQELLENAHKLNKGRSTVSRPQRQKYSIEYVEESVRKSNIALRIDRELACSLTARYKEMTHASRRVQDEPLIELIDDDDDDDCMVVKDNTFCEAAMKTNYDPADLSKLFYLARLKDCNDSELCQQANCIDHELQLVLDDFRPYTGKSMDAPPTDRPVALNSCDVGLEQEELKLE